MASRKRKDPADDAPAPIVLRGFLAAVGLKPGKDGAAPGCVLRLDVGASGLDLGTIGLLVGPRLTITLEAEQLTLVMDTGTEGGSPETPPPEGGA